MKVLTPLLDPLWAAVSPLAFEGQGDLDPDLPWVGRGGQRLPRGGTDDPDANMRCRSMIQRNANMRTECRKQGKVYKPGATVCDPGTCADKPQQAGEKCGERNQPKSWYAETNARLQRTCRTDRGYRWVPPKDDCSLGSCDPVSTPSGVDCDKQPDHPDCRTSTPTPPSTDVQQNVRCRDGSFAPTAAHCERWGRNRTPTRKGLDMADAIKESLPSFDPMVGLPDPFTRPTTADAFYDPRYLTGAAASDEAVKAISEAMGIRGGPVASAAAAGRGNVLQNVYRNLFDEAVTEHGIAADRGENIYNRHAGDWTRAYEPTKFAFTTGLQQGALDQAAQQQAWRQWWEPEQQQRGFGHSRWAVGQNNLAGIIAAIAGGQYQRMPLPTI